MVAVGAHGGHPRAQEGVEGELLPHGARNREGAWVRVSGQGRGRDLGLGFGFGLGQWLGQGLGLGLGLGLGFARHSRIASRSRLLHLLCLTFYAYG